MNYTLLIWEEIPEKTNLFLIPNEEVEKDDRLALMKMAHNKFINSSGWNRGLQFLNEAVLSEDHANDDDFRDDGCSMMYHQGEYKRVKTHEPSPKDWLCCFAKYKVDEKDASALDSLNVTRVILSGFFI
jgi:hypothetical protein